MKTSADQGGCYPLWPKAEVDNTLRNLQNSSYPTKAEFNNCFIIYSKYFQTLKGENAELFASPLSKNNTTTFQVFLVNGSIVCSGLHFWRNWFNMTKFFPNLVKSSWLWWIMRVNWILNFVPCMTALDRVRLCYQHEQSWMYLKVWCVRRCYAIVST